MKKLPWLYAPLALAFALGLAAPASAAGKKEDKAPEAAEKKDDKAAKADEKKDEKAAEAAPAGEVPEILLLDKTGKLAPVKFQHAAHGKLNECKDCHEGDKPLFEQKRSTEGFKMADMHAGKNCGACHDGKDHGARKKVFSSKTCMKCHKK
ncbi:MAG TPA: hypothetical protein DCM05_10345 [Elusimicrobia bacterium]|nr:hypothetical protein [Elusimicrobiota bacterium]